MSDEQPTIACLCPTYKRPQFLRNAIACFQAQTYENRKLFIIDDAPQHDDQKGDRWELKALQHRINDLPAKFMELVKMAGIGVDIYAIWEDDDVYLPHHLQSLADFHKEGRLSFFAPRQVWSTYDQEKGNTILEGAAGRFHASWAYSAPLFTAMSGYVLTERLDFDQQVGNRARQVAGGETNYDIATPDNPSYVYRWGNGMWHGSQQGEEGYRPLWDRLATLDADFVGDAFPQFDDETKMIYDRIA